MSDYESCVIKNLAGENLQSRLLFKPCCWRSMAAVLAYGLFSLISFKLSRKLLQNSGVCSAALNFLVKTMFCDLTLVTFFYF